MALADDYSEVRDNIQLRSINWKSNTDAGTQIIFRSGGTSKPRLTQRDNPKTPFEVRTMYFQRIMSRVD
jgi:hypothetical protein